MGLWDKLFGEVVDVIEWTDDSSNTMVYRHQRHGNEIKFGAKLTVRESQVAIFVNEGEIADVLGPGMYELETKNLPILSTLQNWHHGFQSPFKAEIYFISTRLFTNLKWGTKNPIMMRDAEFGAVRLRTFGTYTIRVDDPAVFLKEIVGTDGYFTVEEISDQLRDLITTRFATILGTANIPVLDIAGNQDKLGDFLQKRADSEFEEYGIELSKVLVENISLPPAVEEALDKRTSMGMIGDLDKYMKYGAAESMQMNGGGSGNAIEMGLGFAMANQMAQQMHNHPQTPPPLPGSSWFIEIDHQSTGPYAFRALRGLIDKGQLTETSLAWTAGMEDWQAAGNIDALDSLLREVPADNNEPPALPETTDNA